MHAPVPYTFGFEYEFISATNLRSGKFGRVGCLRRREKYDEIMEVMHEVRLRESAATIRFSLRSILETGGLMYVPMKEVNAKEARSTFEDEDGTEMILPLLNDGNVKLQWEPDFGAVGALDVDL